MSSNQDITTEKRSATRGADSRTESENHAVRSRACDDDYIDMISHHNERGTKRTKQEPTPEPEEDDEGMRPHN